MLERLMEFFRARMPLAAEHEALVRSLVGARRVKKGEALQRAGDVATHGCFVAEGCLRSYSIDDEGREHVRQFAPEGWWLSDCTSMRDQIPSTYCIEALEDSGVVLMGLAAHTRLMNEIPGYTAAFATGLLKMSAAREKRLLDSLS